jgi:N-acetylglutamate synthase-like GNAT family acetyltransferase
MPPIIRLCSKEDFPELYSLINDAAQAYKDVIPADRWHTPYMSMQELEREISHGVRFSCLESKRKIQGVMGMQDRGDVTLIRHAYVRTEFQNQGIGTQLLRNVEQATDKPILVGTWTAAKWAIGFYAKNGYRLLGEEEAEQLLRQYWQVPQRQIETSVVLALESRWPVASKGHNDSA